MAIFNTINILIFSYFKPSVWLAAVVLDDTKQSILSFQDVDVPVLREVRGWEVDWTPLSDGNNAGLPNAAFVL